jgi:hypothetical protein
MKFLCVGRAFAAMILIAFLFKWVDDRVKARSATPGETTPLNIGV